MPNLQLLLIGASAVYSALLGAVWYFTRPMARRAVGALAGGLAVSIAGAGIEFAGHRLGWWRYGLWDTPIGPLVIYPLLALVWTALALIGWRIERRFGPKGIVLFLLIVGIAGTTRDYRVAAMFPSLVQISPGPAPLIADLLIWPGLTYLAIGVMRLIAGPAAADSLSVRSRTGQLERPS